MADTVSRSNVAIAALRKYFRRPELLDPQTVPEDAEVLSEVLHRIIFGETGARAGCMGIADTCKVLSDEIDSDDEVIPIIVYCDPENSGTAVRGTASWGFQVSNKVAEDSERTDYGRMSGIVGKLNNEEPPDGNEPSRLNPPLSAIFVMRNTISPAHRDADALELFFNSIPTLQLSLCEPYIDVAIHTSRPGANADGRLVGLSLLKFLDGARPINENSISDSVMARQDTKEVTRKYGDKEKAATEVVSSAGMEIFTSPQTLVSPDFGSYNTDFRAAPIIDRFRPFMSLSGLNIKSAGGEYGAITTKYASMDLILHDRSRLAEIAEFVNPDQFSGVHFVIEYGWSHPHNSGEENPYGMFLNSLRRKEKYAMTNTKFSFDAVGQVKINLELAMMGTAEVSNGSAAIRVSDGEGVEDPFKRAQVIARTIKDALQALGKIKKDKTVKKIKNNKVLRRFSDVQHVPALTDKLRDELKALKEQIEQAGMHASKEQLGQGSVDSLLEIGKALDTITDDDPGAKALNSIADAVNKKLIIAGGRCRDKDKEKFGVEPTVDPFLTLTQQFGVLHDSSTIGELNPPRGIGDDFATVSLAKLLLLFVGKPLAASGQFNEVQFVFHTFNRFAGAMGVCDGDVKRPENAANIGEFPIKISEFKQYYRATMNKKMTSNITVKEFMDLIFRRFVNQTHSHGYGYTFYERVWDEKKKKFILRTNPDNKGGKNNKSNRNKIMKKIVGDDFKKFKQPKIKVDIQCVPRIGPGGERFDNADVLRLHIKDDSAVAHEAGVDAIASLASALVEGKSAEKKTDGKQKEKPKDSEEAEGDPDKGGSIVGENPNAAKILKAIRHGMPLITYGSEGSVLKSAQLSSMYDDDLTTINMIRDGAPSGHMQPSGRGQGGLPLQAFPGEMSVTCVGCPILEFGQEFYVDFGTGTTIDNVYIMFDFEHKLKAGSFETSFKLTQTDRHGYFRSEEGYKAAAAGAKQGESHEE